ncbi:MAG: hypothetical protein IPF53_15835 [Blastocatellia bacterium]|nr:hypothetical protein [Blastocatellia bacterium]
MSWPCRKRSGSSAKRQRIGQRDNSTRDPDSSDNDATATTAGRGEPTPADLSVTASGSATSVEAGDSITYTVRVTNSGPNRPRTSLVDSLRAALIS